VGGLLNLKHVSLLGRTRSAFDGVILDTILHVWILLYHC